CKGAGARDAAGKPVAADAAAAVSWCAWGAMSKVWCADGLGIFDAEHERAMDALKAAAISEAAARGVCRSSLAGVNDHERTTKEGVLSWYSNAIEAVSNDAA
ncbi:MAG TPA: hypothetical protein VGF45_06355, partial [Polyangia bacterium]